MKELFFIELSIILWFKGGGLDKDLKPKANMKPIKNEADNGLLNESGTVAMADF